MPKYNLGSASGMEQFQKDLEKSIFDKAKEDIKSGTIEIDCPNCNRTFDARSGLNTCPHCGEQINLQLNFDF